MECIPSRRRLFPLCFAVMGAFWGYLSFAADVGNLAAVSFDSHVLVLEENGNLDAFDSTGKPVSATELKPLQLTGVLNIGAGSDRLYAATATALYQLDHWGGAWRKVATYAARGDSLLRVAVVGNRPLLVYPEEIIDPVAPRKFEVPMSIGAQVHTRALRLQASCATQSILWLGTGHGEWGGHLMGLNPSTGKWVQYYDSLHYVTGITSASAGHVIVSWSMSHFMASTMIRQHGDNGQPEREFPELQESYYQAVTYSKFDRALYAMERNWLVRIVRGKPTRAIELTLRLFKREPKAIGVAPGVIALLPVAEHQIVVVGAAGVPVLVDSSTQKTVSFGGGSL